MKIEQWVDIEGFEDRYQVSNFGNVKSLQRYVKTSRGNGFRLIKEKLLILRTNIDGYRELTLIKEGTEKYFQVHRLVALHFIPNPNNYPCVNHKDEIKANNYDDNLEWCTVDYNNKYNSRQEKINIKLRSLDNTKINLKRKPVNQYDLQGNLVNKFMSINEANRSGWNGEFVSQCCRNLKEKYKGYIWKFLD